MVIRMTFGLVIMWVITLLFYMAWTLAGPATSQQTLMQYAFYGMAAFTLIYTAFYFYASTRLYVMGKDEHGYWVIAIFRLTSMIVFFGALFALFLKPEWFSASQ